MKSITCVPFVSATSNVDKTCQDRTIVLYWLEVLFQGGSNGNRLTEDKTMREHETEKKCVDGRNTAPWRFALVFDPEKFQRFVADAGMTEAEQREYLQIVWEIAVGVIDMGFHIDPVALATENTLVEDSPSVVASGHQSHFNSEDAVGNCAATAQGIDS